MPLGGLLEGLGAFGIADMEIENVGVGVIVDPVEGGLAHCHAHDIFLCRKAVTTRPSPCSR